MRTYTRRRPENREIEGAEELCRLCLEKPEEAVPLFVNDKDCSLLALRIMICVGLEMTNEDSLPNIVCAQCQKELERCYSFRKKCEVSYQKLKSHVLAVKERQHAAAEKLKDANALNLVKVDESGKQNIVFTVNMDGSIQLSDGNNSSSGEPLVTLIKVEDSDLVHCDDTIVLNAPLEANGNIQSRVTAETTIPTNNSKSLLIPLVKPQLTPVEPDLSASQSVSDTDMARFLSTMLIELGIISKHGNDIVTVESSNKSIQIEAGDGSLISMELVEECDEDQSTSELSVQSKNQTSMCNEEESDVLTQDNKTNGSTKKIPASDGSSEKSRPWCSICNKAFVSRGVLARHERDVHKRQRPHACPRCHKRFAQKEVMLRHQLVHEEKRPFQCSQCPKSFTQRGSLETHTRLHTPPDARALALYQCPRCPKVFLYASGVSRHMAQHTGKVFDCGSCSRQFKDKSSLQRHFRLTRHQPRDSAPPAPPPPQGE